MLGDAIAAALPELRREAEAMMLDTCVIKGAEIPGEWDEASGTYGDPTSPTIYAGRCQLPKAAPEGRDVDSGEASWVTGSVMLKLPMTVGDGDEGDPLAVTTGHAVVVTSRGNMPLEVRFVIPQTYEKSRKVACERVTRDA